MNIYATCKCAGSGLMHDCLIDSEGFSLMQEINRFLLKFMISIISILLISCTVIADEDEDNPTRGIYNAVTPPRADTEFTSMAEYKIVSVASHKCLDIPAQSLNQDGAKVQQWSCITGNDNQLFSLVPVGDYYKIVSLASHKCLDIPAQSLNQDGAKVQQWGCITGNDNQLFRLVPVGDYYKIVSVASHKCLDIPAQSLNQDGAKVQQWGCITGNDNQLFRLVPV
jgi:hypothetical protein